VSGRREQRHPIVQLRFQISDLLPLGDPISVPLLRLMAASNDVRHAMKQIIRAQRGGRAPRNRAERAIRDGEQLYLVRMLCGHLEEARLAFRNLWLTQRTRRRLRSLMVVDAAGRAALDLLQREFVSEAATGLHGRFLNPVRNQWAFHYLDQPYRQGLHRMAGERSVLLIARAAGLSRYIVTDDFIRQAVLDASGGTRPAYEKAVSEAVAVGGALGSMVDRVLLGLLNRPKAQYSRRDTRLMLERALARGQREAEARRTGRRE